VKRITVPGKPSNNGSGTKTDLRTKSQEGRALDRQRRFRELQAGFRAIVSEMKRVTWPSREEWVSATIVVIGLVVVVAAWTKLISFIVELLLGQNQ